MFIRKNRMAEASQIADDFFAGNFNSQTINENPTIQQRMVLGEEAARNRCQRVIQQQGNIDGFPSCRRFGFTVTTPIRLNKDVCSWIKDVKQRYNCEIVAQNTYQPFKLGVRQNQVNEYYGSGSSYNDTYSNPQQTKPRFNQLRQGPIKKVSKKLTSSAKVQEKSYTVYFPIKDIPKPYKVVAWERNVDKGEMACKPAGEIKSCRFNAYRLPNGKVRIEIWDVVLRSNERISNDRIKSPQDVN